MLNRDVEPGMLVKRHDGTLALVVSSFNEEPENSKGQHLDSLFTKRWHVLCGCDECGGALTKEWTLCDCTPV